MEQKRRLEAALADRYQIEREIGSGGMAAVYLAQDLKHYRQVAVKVLNPQLAQTLGAERFLREIRTVANFAHPHILPLFDSGEADGFLFYVMPFVEGESLADRLKKEKQLPVEEAIRIAREIADGLAYAHDRGVVHRDVKPANIMLEAGHAVIADFGILKAMAVAGADTETLTDTGISIGTPAYLSPEQATGDEVDGRSDLYSLACVTYEMLTGEPPFIGTNARILIQKHLAAPPPSASVSRPSVGDELARAIQRAMAKTPADRFANARQYAEALTEGQERSERPVPERSFRRGRWAKTLLISALAVIVAVQGFRYALKHLSPTPAAALAFQARDWILITDFQNLTGDEVFSGSLNTALTVSIEQSPYINVFPRARVPEVLQRMRREGLERLDVELGSEIAVREGIKAILAGSISQVGDAYILGAQLVDPHTQASVLTLTVRADGKGQVLDALEDLAVGIRENLGESLGSISQVNLNLPAATTASLEALKAFSEGHLTDIPARIALYREAVELDPEFALAHANLGVDYYIFGDAVKGEEHFQRALTLLDRLTLKERLWIRAVVEDWRGNRDQGIQNYRTYLSQYPDDPSAWYRLGYACMITNRLPEAIEAFERVLEIRQEDAHTLVNIASSYHLEEKYEEALAYYERAFAADPELMFGLYVNHEYGMLLIKMGRFADAEETYRRMAAQADDARRSKGHRSLGLLKMYLGKYSEAESHFRQAAVINQNGRFGLSELRDRLFLATVYDGKGVADRFQEEMEKVLTLEKAINAAPPWLFRIGQVLARSGRAAQAEPLLEEMSERLGDPRTASGVNRWERTEEASYLALRGEIELAKGKNQEAVALFQEADGLMGDTYLEPLAFGLSVLGEQEQALDRYLEFVRRPRVGDETQLFWILAHARMGEIYEEMGEDQKAVEYYERFLDIWRDADPDLVAVHRVQGSLASLRSKGH